MAKKKKLSRLPAPLSPFYFLYGKKNGKGSIEITPNGWVFDCNGQIVICYASSPDKISGLVLPRKSARLLATRINQCLDKAKGSRAHNWKPNYRKK